MSLFLTGTHTKYMGPDPHTKSMTHTNCVEFAPETLLNTYGDGMQRAVGRYGRDADKGGLAATHHGWVGGSSLVFCLRFGSPVVVAFPRMQ